MLNLKEFFAGNASAKNYRDTAWIALLSVAVLSASSSVAWLLHSGVTKATAQSGQQIAATGPDRNSSQLRADFSNGFSDIRTVASRIEKITIEDQKSSVVEGRAPVRALVTLSVAGKAIGTATANSDGIWSVAVERGLGVGDHRLAVRIVGANGEEDGSDTARISVPRGLSGPLVITYAGIDAAPARATILTVADGATSLARFAQVSGSASAMKSWTDNASATATETATVRPIILAQSAPTPEPPAPPAAPPTGSSALDTLQNWLRRSNETYQKAIVKRLTEPTTLEEIEARAKTEEAEKAVDLRAVDQKALEPKAVDVKPVDPKAADPKIAEDAARKAREELRAAQAKRDEDLKQAEIKRKAADDIAKEAATKAPVTAPSSVVDEASRKQAEDKRIADETIKRQADLKAAEEKRAADAKKAADDAASRAAEAKKAADDVAARKQANEKRLAEDAQKRQADLKAAEEKRAADAKKAADDVASRSAEVKKAADDMAARKQADEKRASDAVARRQADEKRSGDAKKTADETAAAKSAEAKKSADDAISRKQAEDRRVFEETAKRLADAKKVTDEKRLEADAAKRAADDAKRVGELARQTEARRQADLRAAEDARRNAASLADAASRITKPGSPSVVMPASDAASSPPVRTSGHAATLRSSRPSRQTRTTNAAASVRRRAAAKECSLAGNRVTPPGYYIVKAGDTLWDIADLHYDDGTRFALLRRANRKIDPDVIRPCQRIYVPANKRG